jgi:hypothetical protein
MASALYPVFKEKLLTAGVDVETNNVNAYLIDTADYTYSAAHTVIADVAAAAREEVVALSSKTITGGVFDAADSTWTAAAGDPIEAIILHESVNDVLVAYIDLAGSTTLDGGDIIATWDSGASKIFAL